MFISKAVVALFMDVCSACLQLHLLTRQFFPSVKIISPGSVCSVISAPNGVKDSSLWLF
jgi:hypothetical protein